MGRLQGIDSEIGGHPCLAAFTPRPIPTSTRSNACKNRDRSALRNGGGPPPTPSIPARRSSMMARVAMALPMLAASNSRPSWRSTVAPAFRQRSASRMSAVTTTACGPAFSAIQSSAASKLSETTTRFTRSLTGTRKGLLLTTRTWALWRSATR